MRFIIGLILVAVAAFTAPFFTPWWGIAPLAFLIGLLVGAKWWQSLIYGLLGVGLVWFYQVYTVDAANESILSTQMAEVFNLKGAMTMVGITAALGAVLGGLATLAGSLIRQAFTPKKKRRRSPNVSYRKKRRR